MTPARIMIETRITIKLWNRENPCAQNPTYKSVNESQATGPKIDATTRARDGRKDSLDWEAVVGPLATLPPINRANMSFVRTRGAHPSAEPELAGSRYHESAQAPRLCPPVALVAGLPTNR